MSRTACMLYLTVAVVLSLCVYTRSARSFGEIRYEPNWDSLDSRPLPKWYDEGKIGIFIHWGVFSVPSFKSEWFWYKWKGPKPESDVVEFMKKNYPPDWTYADFAKEFKTPTGIYDPNHWADIFNASGARYVVQVTKHHEGFTSWPSKYSFNWNAKDVGPNRDLVVVPKDLQNHDSLALYPRMEVLFHTCPWILQECKAVLRHFWARILQGDLAAAVRRYPNLRYGVYHSLFEWFNPLYIEDKNNLFQTQKFVFDKTLPELYELVHLYKPEIIWSDGCAGPDTYWNSTSFLAWLYNDSPVKDVVVTNDRWGKGLLCHHGGFYTCKDRYNPGVLQKHKFENAMTLDKHSWGYRRNMNLKEVLTIEELITDVVITVSCNGNILINVGPTKDGSMPPIFEERLRQLGSWLNVNGEGIYKSRPWTYQNDTKTPNVWYTMKPATSLSGLSDVYAFALQWPEDNQLLLAAPTPSKTTVVTLLGYNTPIPYQAIGNQGLLLSIPAIPFSKMPCQWAWVFKLTEIVN